MNVSIGDKFYEHKKIELIMGLKGSGYIHVQQMMWGSATLVVVVANSLSSPVLLLVYAGMARELCYILQIPNLVGLAIAGRAYKHSL